MGRHLAERLLAGGHDVRLLSRSGTEPPPNLREGSNLEVVQADVADRAALDAALAGCDAVAHLAGINLARGGQTFEAVHVEGTRNVVAAAEAEGVSRLVLSSFLRARPACGSAYHESKWAAEELVRDADVEHTVLKIGVTYGRGDHLVNHLARALLTVPVFPLVGAEPTPVRPLAVADLVDVLAAALVHGHLRDSTVPVVGPEELSLEALVSRIGAVLFREPRFVRLPASVHYALARVQEAVVETPLASRAQVRMLEEGLAEPAPVSVCEELPAELAPERPFDRERIAAVLPDLEPFGPRDLRLPI